MKKMKALVKKFPQQGIWLDEVPIPEYGPNDVLIKIHSTSICGTDIHIYNWDEWAQKTIPVPMIIGHEYVGTVEAFGENVHDVHIGEVVSGEGHLVCGQCRHCRAGRGHLCPFTKGVGVNRPGCFAEFLVIPVSNIWHCDPKIPKEILSIFDPLGNAVHTALSFDILGEDVLITGAGPIGIMASAICKHAGARNVVITDINPYRLELAKKMGVTRVVDATKENLFDIIKELGMVGGFDVGLEMSGSPKALNDMIDVMYSGGNIALLGILPSKYGIDWNKVIFKGLTIRGIYGRIMYETWYKMQSMVQTGLDVSPIITHKFKVDNYLEAFELMKSGNSGKVLLTWSD
jgi:threonine 3-dehydrogenase